MCDSLIWVVADLLLDDSDSIEARTVPSLPGGWMAAVRLDVGRSGGTCLMYLCGTRTETVCKVVHQDLNNLLDAKTELKLSIRW